MHDSLLVSRDDCTEWKKKKEGKRGREGERTDESGTQRRGVTWRGAARRGPEPRLRRQGDG